MQTLARRFPTARRLPPKSRPSLACRLTSAWRPPLACRLTLAWRPPLAGRLSRSWRFPRWTRGLVASAALLLAACAGPGTRVGMEPAPRVDPAKRTEVVMTALSLLQSDYRYGSARPARGFDCSGLVKYVFDAAADTSLPHNTAQIAHLSRPIPRGDLRPGDFVFFDTLGRSNSHMGIYMGDGRFINAPSTGGQVRIDSLDNPYYRRHFESARTVFVD